MATIKDLIIQGLNIKETTEKEIEEKRKEIFENADYKKKIAENDKAIKREIKRIIKGVL